MDPIGDAIPAGLNFLLLVLDGDAGELIVEESRCLMEEGDEEDYEDGAPNARHSAPVSWDRYWHTKGIYIYIYIVYLWAGNNWLMIVFSHGSFRLWFS